MRAEILCVGTELLLGDIINTNAAFIARKLAELGINCYYQSVVGDNDARLRKSLELSLSRSELIVMTGGLGPTYDDMTKETVASYFGREMELHEQSLERIKVRFAQMGRDCTDNNLKQAYMPKGAVVFKNDYGTAPALAVESEDGDKRIVIMLPGPPREMQPIFVEEVMPYLAAMSDRVLVSSVVHIFGMGESAVEDKLRDMMVSMDNPTIAPYCKEGEVQLRVTASGENAEECRALIAPVVEQIKSALGDVVYGVDVGTLQNALVAELKSAGLKIATAESCTGGLIAKNITDVSGSSEVFDCGIVAYANDIKSSVLGVSADTLQKYGAVSSQTALEMARGAARISGADIAVSTTGIAGPTGGSVEKPVGLVYIGLWYKGRESFIELRLTRGSGERDYIRRLAVLNAMNEALKLIKF